MDWLRSVINEVIEAGVELASENEPDTTSQVEKRGTPRTSFDENTIDSKTQSDTSTTTAQTPTNSINTSSGSVRRSRSASNPFRFLDAILRRDEKAQNEYMGADPLQLGVTPLLKEYVRNLCQHPQTWVDFPVEAILASGVRKQGVVKGEDNQLTFQLTNKEGAHAIAILAEVPELSELRYQLCPRLLSEDRFWQVYFLLLSNKFQLDESDDSFSMPDLQRSNNSLQYNLFVTRYGSTDKIDGQICPISLPTDGVSLSISSSSPTSSDSAISVQQQQQQQLEDELEWWNALPTGCRADSYESTFKGIVQGSQQTSSNWDRVDLALLKQDRPKIFKMLLRCGVPDEYRCQAWKVAPSTSIKLTNQPKPSVSPRNTSITNGTELFSYSYVLQKVFGSQIPLYCDPIPDFGGNISFHQNHHLSNSSTTARTATSTSGGIPIVRRLLTTLAMSNITLHFAPAVVDLVAILVSFMSESDAFYVAQVVISESTDRCHYVPLGNRQITLFGHAFHQLFTTNFPELLEHLGKFKIQPEGMFKKWISQLFVGYLPYQTVLRMIDCLLYEGSTVLYRVALAVFSSAKDALLTKINSVEDYEHIMETTLNAQLDPSKLLLAAWTFKIKHKDLIVIYQSVVDKGVLNDVIEFEMDIFRSPTVLNDSSILSACQFETLWRWIPARYRCNQLQRIFVTEEDGCNLTTLVAKCEGYMPTLFLLKAKNQSKFGVFLHQEWKPDIHYYGSAESFLFTILPKERKFECTPASNECYMRLTPKFVMFGGGDKGDGLRLDHELWHGQSYRSDTYNNLPLHGDESDPDFEATLAEVYALV